MALPIPDPTNMIVGATNIATTITNVASIPTVTGLDVVGQVNALYSSSFDKLFALVLCILGLVGVVLPILLPLYQKWITRTELKSQLGKHLENAKTELIHEIEKKFEAEKAAIDLLFKKNLEAIEKRVNNAEGHTYHLQAHRNLENKNYQFACTDFCKAADLYCKAEAGHVLTRTIRLIIDRTLPQLNKSDLERDGLESRLDDLLKNVGKINQNGYLNDLLRDFAASYREAKKR